jgi:hypothetical protein
MRAQEAYAGIGLPATMKWDKYVEFQQNTKEFSAKQKKAAKLAAAAKSGNVDHFLRSEKSKRLKRESSRKRVRVKPKKSLPRTYSAVGEDEDSMLALNDNHPSGPGIIRLNPLDTPSSMGGPQAANLVLDEASLKGKKGGKTFVPGAHRAAKLEESRAKMTNIREKGSKHAEKMAMTNMQIVRRAAMEKRAKMWDEHKEKKMNKALRKVQRTWLQKKTKLWYELYITRRPVKFPAEKEFTPINQIIDEFGLTQRDLRRFRAAFETYDFDLSGEIVGLFVLGL